METTSRPLPPELEELISRGHFSRDGATEFWSFLNDIATACVDGEITIDQADRILDMVGVGHGEDLTRFASMKVSDLREQRASHKSTR